MLPLLSTFTTKNIRHIASGFTQLSAICRQLSSSAVVEILRSVTALFGMSLALFGKPTSSDFNSLMFFSYS